MVLSYLINTQKEKIANDVAYSEKYKELKDFKIFKNNNY